MPIMDRMKLLIVEDDADVRLGYQVLLKANHYETLFAADAASALSQALKHRPDLIILDLGLPAGDGFLVLERVRANLNLTGVPIVVVSARDLIPNKDRALRAGAQVYLQKPWNDDELLGIISHLLDRSDTLISSTAPALA
jgi:DNA-binding response OmpR family regulator